jgi:hypothetical protein
MVVVSTGFSFPAILFSLSASYNLINFYELALLLVICPIPAILFSLSASYNLIIFYQLALSLVICPFPAILITLFMSIITFLTKVSHHHHHHPLFFRIFPIFSLFTLLFSCIFHNFHITQNYPKLNSEKIWKIQKQIVKWYGKYGRKASRTVIRYGQYGRKTSWTVKIYEKYGRNLSWIMKRFGKCRRKMCKDMENTDEK